MKRLFKDIPKETTSLLNVLYSNYPEVLISTALDLIDGATGTNSEKASSVSAKLVAAGLTHSRANLLIEVLIALIKFAETNSQSDNMTLKVLSNQLNESAAQLNTAVENSKKVIP